MPSCTRPVTVISVSYWSDGGLKSGLAMKSQVLKRRGRKTDKDERANSARRKKVAGTLASAPVDPGGSAAVRRMDRLVAALKTSATLCLPRTGVRES